MDLACQYIIKLTHKLSVFSQPPDPPDHGHTDRLSTGKDGGREECHRHHDYGQPWQQPSQHLRPCPQYRTPHLPVQHPRRSAGGSGNGPGP